MNLLYHMKHMRNSCYAHEWYLKNKEKISEKFKQNYSTKEFRDKKQNQRIRYMDKWKAMAFNILGKKCIKCGFSDSRALQFDHINGDGYLENRNRTLTYYKKIFLSVENGEKRYQILCCNCNWIKRVENKEHCRTLDKEREKIVDKIRTEIKQESTLFPI